MATVLEGSLSTSGIADLQASLRHHSAHCLPAGSQTYRPASDTTPLTVSSEEEVDVHST